MASPKADLDAATRQDITELVGSIAIQLPLLDAQREGIEMYAAPRFSGFELFRPTELALSRIIAELLDPRGIHGQGTLFLNAFLKSLALPPVRSHGSVNVELEAPTSLGRRIDLVIETPDVLLGIENKPTAIQQPNQLGHYLDELETMAGRKRPCLVFLSDQQPRSVQEHVICMPFADDSTGPSLLRILRSSRDGVRAPRVGEFLDDFMNYLAEYFGEGAMPSDSYEPYLRAVELEFDSDPRRRRAIAAVFLAHQGIFERSVGEIGQFIAAKLRDYNDDMQLITDRRLYDVLEERDALWGFRRPHWPQNCAVGLSSEGDHYNIYYGIQAPSIGDDACPSRALVDAAAAKVPNGRKTRYWPWWQYAEPSDFDYEHIAQLMIETPNGVLVEHKDIQGLAMRLIELSEALDATLESDLGGARRK